MRIYPCVRRLSFPPGSRSWVGKTVGEHRGFEQRRREAEMKWARRCLWAMLVALGVGFIAGLSFGGGLVSRGKG